ncbi:hypothetical protein [uncultured Methanobrevibacter sp.]|uniref:hypothetical protein n=1 Tax=uncultured Methanobrevibacter sp. TaxID=253161 RepID=UPI0025FCC265|nr:hypothetical protein [uncultured Methanobrevibacter sp.]
MFNKKIIMLTIFLISLLTITVVSATDNGTNDIVSVGNATEVTSLCDDVVSVNDLENDNVTNNQDTLGISESQDEISLDNDVDVLSARSPSSSDYDASISKITVNSDGSVSIKVSITPCTSSGYYTYDFKLDVYDSNGTWRNHKVFNSIYSDTSITHTLGAGKYGIGTYRVILTNTADDEVMSRKTFTIESPTNPSDSTDPTIPTTLCERYPSTYPTYLDYSVDVSDIFIIEGSDACISMNISPASSKYYKYHYRLEISGGNWKSSIPYYGTTPAYSKTYNISSDKLNVGVYTINIINEGDNQIMDTAIIRVDSPPFYPSYLDYSVDVSDTSIPYGSSGYINMNITPASACTLKHYYDLRVYDSNNNEIISKLYFDSDPTYSESYRVGLNQLDLGNYTIKIINGYDNKVMDTANLYVKYYPSYSDYSVSISDTTITSGSYGAISMTVSLSTGSTMKYSYYLKIFDSGNKEVSSKFYNSTSTYTRFGHDIFANELTPGVYTVKIINYADNKLMATAKLTANKNPTKITTSDVTTTYNGNNYLVVTLKNQNNPIKGKKLSIDLNGVKTLTTDANGQVKVSTDGLIPKTYTATITFEGDNLYDKSTATAKVVVNKIEVSLSSTDVNVVYNSNGCLVDTLKDATGKPLEGFDISINLNGVKTLTTDANGQVKVSIDGFVPKTYTATISFDGNNIYEKSTVTAQVIVKKATPKITAKAKTFKKSVKTKKYTITLKNNLNKIMKNTKVTIKVNKKTYSAKTNSKGVATFKITKLTKKGSFISVITYNGNKYYNKITKKVKINVK